MRILPILFLAGCGTTYVIVAAEDDPRRAQHQIELLESGCQANDATACHSLAQVLLKGDDHDRGRAQALLRTACRGGLATACVTLAREKLATPEDLQLAIHQLEPACDRKDVASCVELGHLYLLGIMPNHRADRVATVYEVR